MARLAALQFKARPTKAASLRALGDLFAGVRADLVVLPEMCATGYGIRSAAHARALAEPADGPMVRAFADLARRSGAWLIAGFPERAGDDVFNAASVHDPSGALRGVYRKTLLFEADTWAKPGDSGYLRFDTDIGRVGVGICMDLNDDRFLAHAASEAIDILALPTNWVQDEGDMHHYWRFRLDRGWPAELCIEHGDPARAPVDALLIGANSYGTEGDWQLRGESAIVHRGGVIAQAPCTGDHWITASLRV